jgi:G3E family GTPase
VTRPLLAYHGNQVQVAPLTILLDAEREIHGYPEAVRYLYRQQLAEAEILALSKSDRMAPESKAQIVRRLAQKYSPAQVVSLSARTGEGVAEWLATVMAQPSQAVQTLTLDYQEYAAAEAQLSWLNAQGTLWGVRPFSAKNWLNHWLRMIDASLASAGGAIAHIKMQVATPAALLKASLTHSGAPVSWELAPDDESVHSTELAQFILNARVNTTPRILEQAVRQTFAEMTPEPKFRYEFVHFECFSPRPPQPTYHLGGI